MARSLGRRCRFMDRLFIPPLRAAVKFSATRLRFFPPVARSLPRSGTRVPAFAPSADPENHRHPDLRSRPSRSAGEGLSAARRVGYSSRGRVGRAQRAAKGSGSVTRQVTHDGRGSLEVRFPYDRRLVELVKTLPSRRWVASERFWQVPDEDVVALVELLHAERFSFDETTRGLYVARGGRLPLDGARSAPFGPGGLFEGLEREPEPAPASRAGADDYTVLRLNREVQSVLEQAFPVPVWLVGEISGFNKNAHKRYVSFSLVERSPDGIAVAQVHAVLFEDARRAIERRLSEAGAPFRLEDEIAVRVRARVELYDAWGQYRVRIEDLDVAYTLGEAARRREEILRRLAAEGLLERNRSLPFPDWPLRVGIVTSIGSDAYNDVLRTLQESGFAFEVTVHGARVQGRQTEQTVLAALDWFRERAARFDLVLVVRGGGSRTDLSWFDSEPLGRAVATFPLPVVVGIGHEQDVSVLDSVGWRAKTPTAAAMLVVERVQRSLGALEEKGRAVLEGAAALVSEARRSVLENAARLARATRARLGYDRSSLDTCRTRLLRSARSRLESARRDLFSRAMSLPRAAARLLVGRRGALEQGVRQLAQGSRRDLAAASRRISQHRAALATRSLKQIAQERERPDARARRLHLVEPRRVVERGYAILRGPDGRALTDASVAPVGTRLRAELRRGALRLRSEGPEASEGED